MYIHIHIRVDGFDRNWHRNMLESVVVLFLTLWAGKWKMWNVLKARHRQAEALRAIRTRAEELEDMALDVAEEAQTNAGRWAEAAKKQRDEREAERSERPEKLERLDGRQPGFTGFGLSRPTSWNRPHPTHCKQKQGRSSAEFNRSRFH